MRRLIAIALTAAATTTVLAIPQGAAPAGQGVAATTAWPQKATVDGTTYLLNAPAFTAINGNTVSMRCTVQVKKGEAAPVDGTVEMSAVMAQAEAPGYVELSDFQIASCAMPDGSGAAVQSGLESLLKGMGIESLLTNIVQGVAIDATHNVTGLSNDVPAIRVMERPAVLISVNGEPAFGSCGSGWQRVVNTPSILLKSPDGAWYTRVGGSQWLSSASMNGPFAAAGSPPSDVVAEIGRQPAPPAGTQAPAPREPAGVPDVVIATKPTILVSIAGAPKLEPACDGVQWVSNCSTPLLKAGGNWLVLGSGRWFSASDLVRGPWSYVAATDLPASLANLPATGPLAVARASVPSTLEANSASAAAGLVRAITVPRSAARCTVRFRGEPKFKSIDGGLSYASNSSQPVIQADGAMYCCDDGAWYKASSANGPWSVCDAVPPAIYQIPASCPAFPCTYVSVVASSPESVTFGSTAGYLGTYMQDGVPVYGTGYDYNAMDPQPVDGAQANVASYVAPSYPATYGNQTQYSYDTGTYAPQQTDGSYYGYADMYPSVYGTGYGGWGYSPYWGSAWGYGCGYGYGWGYGGWGAWNRGWNNWGDRRGWDNGNRGLDNRGMDNRVAAENRWNTARMNAGVNRGGVGGVDQGARGPTGMGRAAGFGSPSGWHSPTGSHGASGFSPARYGNTGGYRHTSSGGGGGGARRGGGGGGRR